MTNFLPTIAILVALAAGAQQSDTPGLQHRAAGAPEEQSVKVTLQGGKTVLPEDAFGLYRYADRPGEFGEGLQINQQFGEVTGYFSVPGGSATGSPIGSKSRGKLSTYFLSEVTGGDPSGSGHFAFATRAVHGVWYGFDGKVFRGPGADPTQDAYYLMEGTLTAHDDVRKSARDTKISLKLTAVH